MGNTERPVILVVDDEQTYLNVITKTLKERNFKILQALNGAMGIMVARKFLPDIIITDWEMPEMNGIEAIQLLKNDENTRDIPIIMCTGIMTSSENLDTALNAGATDYIRKPVEPLELIARINSSLNIARGIKEIKLRNQQIEEQKLQIENKNAELVELVATKDKFFSIIAHDLKNPLFGISGFSKMILARQTQLDIEKMKEFIGQIGKTADEAYKLLENLLDWASLQRGLMIPEMENYHLTEIVDEVLSLSAEVARSKNIKVENHVTPDCFICCDKNMTKTVLRNLVSNALKYSKIDGVVIVSSQISGSFVQISVKDSGVGISSQRMNNLFKIQRNISTPGTSNEKGTGLGLILCKEMVEKQQGRIWVESEEGKGSSFIFTLKRPLQ